MAGISIIASEPTVYQLARILFGSKMLKEKAAELDLGRMKIRGYEGLKGASVRIWFANADRKSKALRSILELDEIFKRAGKLDSFVLPNYPASISILGSKNEAEELAKIVIEEIEGNCGFVKVDKEFSGNSSKHTAKVVISRNIVENKFEDELV